MNEALKELAKGLAKGGLVGLVVAMLLARKLEMNPVAQALYFGTLMIIGWHLRKLFERK